MVQVIADGAMKAMLEPIKERAEILGDDGMLLGYFDPPKTDDDALYRKAALLFAPDEAEQIKNVDGPWRTTEEVLERLRSLENG